VTVISLDKRKYIVTTRRIR